VVAGTVLTFRIGVPVWRTLRHRLLVDRVTPEAPGLVSVYLRRVAALRPGTRVLIEGPYGRMTAATYTGGPITMLACGVGVTPLLALLWDLPYQHGAATLVYRTRHAHDVAFVHELDWLARNRGVRLVLLVDPRDTADSWLPAEYGDYTDNEALRELAPDIADHDVYVCGPDAWTTAVLRSARRTGVAPNRLHRERFAW
jgi:ferredoxin-NADP reductase